MRSLIFGVLQDRTLILFGLLRTTQEAIRLGRSITRASSSSRSSAGIRSGGNRPFRPLSRLGIPSVEQAPHLPRHDHQQRRHKQHHQARADVHTPHVVVQRVPHARLVQAAGPASQVDIRRDAGGGRPDDDLGGGVAGGAGPAARPDQPPRHEPQHGVGHTAGRVRHARHHEEGGDREAALHAHAQRQQRQQRGHAQRRAVSRPQLEGGGEERVAGEVQRQQEQRGAAERGEREREAVQVQGAPRRRQKPEAAAEEQRVCADEGGCDGRYHDVAG